MCFAALDLLIKSCLLKYYYDILAKTCHFLTGLDFTAAWPFNFNSSDCGKGYQCIEENKQTKKTCTVLDKFSTPKQLEDTAVEHFLDPWQQFHSRGYGAVKMWPLCSELPCVLLCIHYAFYQED